MFFRRNGGFRERAPSLFFLLGSLIVVFPPRPFSCSTYAPVRGGDAFFLGISNCSVPTKTVLLFDLCPGAPRGCAAGEMRSAEGGFCT